MATTSYKRRMATANYQSWQRSNDYSLESAYGRYSSAKAEAWTYCENLCKKYDGWGLKVISHNTFTFTAGFEYTDVETGVLMFMFITPSYDFAVKAV